MLNNSNLNIFVVMLLVLGSAAVVFLSLPQFQSKNVTASPIDSSLLSRSSPSNYSVNNPDSRNDISQPSSEDNLEINAASNSVSTNASTQSFGTVKIDDKTFNISENVTTVHELPSNSNNSSHISVTIDGSSDSSSTNSGSSTSVSLRTNSKSSVVRVERSSTSTDD